MDDHKYPAQSTKRQVKGFCPVSFCKAAVCTDFIRPDLFLDFSMCCEESLQEVDMSASARHAVLLAGSPATAQSHHTV